MTTLPVFTTSARCTRCGWVQARRTTDPTLAVDYAIDRAAYALAEHMLEHSKTGPKPQVPRKHRAVEQKPRRQGLTWRGEHRSLREWARITGIPQTTITTRLHRGWSISRTLTEAVR